MKDKTVEAAKAWIRYCEKYQLSGIDATSAAIAVLVQIVTTMECDLNLKQKTANLLVKTLNESFAETLNKRKDLN